MSEGQTKGSRMENCMKKIIVVGASGYIGNSFIEYCKREKRELQIQTLSVRDEEWKKQDFSGVDTVLYAAGKAHADVGHVAEEVKKEYYRVNCDLACEVAQKAKINGVQQFIYLSSAIIYGDSAPVGTAKVITADTMPAPANFYGDSKWKADQALQKMETDAFHVAVLRLPMVYGANSKGNFPLLEKMAQRLIVFPNIKNERSMIYIGNLCEFLGQLIEHGDGGIFFPQNATYSCTTKMVEEIAEAHGKKIHTCRVFTPFIWVLSRMPGKGGVLAKKAFGNLTYDLKLSHYWDDTYRRINTKASICSSCSHATRHG